MLNLANKLSILRILLIPPFVATIMYYTPEKDFLRLVAIGIFLMAIITDALDGYIARVRFQSTKLGSFLDTVADKLLLITTFICLSIVKTLPPQFKLGAWVVIIVISRDVIIVLGSTIIFMLNDGKLTVAPTALGKITTMLQVVTVLALLLQAGIFPFLLYAMIFFTVLSGLDYIRVGSRLFNEGVAA
jgi:CDP-diacylglycerol--glycerol-3-phosphate 3-phosphatidyltransferase